MVSAKKTASKTKRTAKKVASPLAYKTPEVKEETKVSEMPTPTALRPKKEMPKLKTSEETAWTLLDAAPEMPYLTSIQDAVKFADEYARWKRDVRGAK